MRQALRGLTTRGRAFVAAGITASLCALLLGQKDLLRVGDPAGRPAAGRGARGRPDPAAARRSGAASTPDQVPVGTAGDGRACPEQPGPDARRAAAARGPHSLCTGHRPRFVVDRVSPNWRRTVTYPVKSDVRGLFQVGPLMLTVADPFGLVETSRTFTRSQHLLVTPRVYKLPESGSAPTGPAPARTGRGRSRPRARRTPPSASTATATTCAGCTGGRPRGAAR